MTRYTNFDCSAWYVHISVLKFYMMVRSHRVIENKNRFGHCCGNLLLTGELDEKIAAKYNHRIIPEVMVIGKQSNPVAKKLMFLNLDYEKLCSDTQTSNSFKRMENLLFEGLLIRLNKCFHFFIRLHNFSTKIFNAITYPELFNISK